MAKIDEIDFDNYSIKVEDQKAAIPAAFNIDQLAFTLKGVSNQSNAPVTANLSMRFQETGAIGLAGTLTLMPPSADMQVTVSNLDLRAVQPYVEEQVMLVLTGGALDVHGRARLARRLNRSAPKLSFTGDAGLSNFDTTDDVLFKDFAKWETLSVSGIKLAMQPDSLRGPSSSPGSTASLVIGPDKRPNFCRRSCARKSPERTRTAAEPTGRRSS